MRRQPTLGVALKAAADALEAKIPDLDESLGFYQLTPIVGVLREAESALDTYAADTLRDLAELAVLGRELADLLDGEDAATLARLCDRAETATGLIAVSELEEIADGIHYVFIRTRGRLVTLGTAASEDLAARIWELQTREQVATR